MVLVVGAEKRVVFGLGGYRAHVLVQHLHRLRGAVSRCASVSLASQASFVVVACHSPLSKLISVPVIPFNLIVLFTIKHRPVPFAKLIVRFVCWN